MATRERIGLMSAAGSTVLSRARARARIYPVVALLILAGVGYWGSTTLESSLRVQMTEKLKTILNADVTALRIWIEVQKGDAEIAAQDPRLIELAQQLIALSKRKETTPEILAHSEPQAEVRTLLQPLLETRGYVGFGITDERGRIVAATSDDSLGADVEKRHGRFMDRILEGESIASPPHRVKGWDEPSMIVATALKDADGRVFGLFGFSVKLEEFTEILQVARPGDSGETYAFDTDGVLLSQSRFEDDLRAIGLLAEGADSMLNIDVRNPGGNMAEGFRTDTPRQALPLTLMAASAIEGGAGSNVDGYNDYRGVPVVGAWTWLPEYAFGVTTELDVTEAYQTLYAVRTTFWVLITLLTAGALGGLVASQVIYRLRRTVSEVQQLGQYSVGEKIGEGGMGAVYRASHAMLHRDAAIKILQSGDASGERAARFEREVQLTSSLRHPNTIEIYDYGRSPDGTFYYVMEYLNGLSLRQIVQESGPLPPERIIHVLQQTCGSLAEAHEAGLIHRDVTPGNIMLCELGGLYDVVKVLDFGLVKDVGSTTGPQLTQVGQIAGTPHYMAPETLINPDKVDARIDLYALGGVGYYMATGNTVFSGETSGEVLNKHLNEQPAQPSKRIQGSFPEDLEKVLMQCLAKSPDDRPASAAALLEMLGDLEDAQGWDFRKAREWWTRRSTDSLEKAG